MDDEALLAGSIERLKASGRIDYRGEFGAEVATFIPYVAWLKREGLLDGRMVVSYRGMRPYYSFLSDDEFAARTEPRAWLPPGERDWPSPETATAVRSRWHVMPDYRAHYRDALPPSPLPVLFVQNKFTVEWGVGPVNFMPLIAIERLLRRVTGRFRVIYSRPGITPPTDDYTPDENTHCAYPDRAMVERFEGVEILEDMAVRTGGDYNALKLALLAQAHLFVAVQGGGAHLLAAFGRSLMLLLH
nr:hypothetical protein [Sphingomonadaceae bacterium]